MPRKKSGAVVLILDTAGRLAIDEQMMDEIRGSTMRSNRPKPCSSSTA